MPANPFALKAHIGLDDLPSRIVVTEVNDFLWPAPALRAPRKPAWSITACRRPASSLLSVTGFCRRTRIAG